MIDRAFMECVNHIARAGTALRKLEKLTCRIAAERKAVTTGQACLRSFAEAKETLAKIRAQLAEYEARLQQLVEGVDADAAVR